MHRRLFEPDDKIAPGLYMKYWQAIVKKHGPDALDVNKLKTYREVRNGAILAALWTKATGSKHFISFPHDEPADVEVYRLAPRKFQGKLSYELQKIPVQLTRCSLANGETISGQIIKKNKCSLENMTLIVHMIGEDNTTINLNKIVEDVARIEKIFPREIAVIAPIEDPGSNQQTFAQLLVYSRDDNRPRASRVNLGEKDAFFDTPSVMRSHRGTGRAIELSGEFSLMLP